MLKNKKKSKKIPLTPGEGRLESLIESGLNILLESNNKPGKSEESSGGIVFKLAVLGSTISRK